MGSEPQYCRGIRTRWHVAVIAVLVFSQLAGTFLARPRHFMLEGPLGLMQSLTGAAGNFLFFAGPLTSRLTRHYGNVEVIVTRGGIQRSDLLTRRLSGAQAQQLRVLLLRGSSVEAQARILDRIARFVLSKEEGLQALTLRLVHRDARQTPLRTQITLARTYAVSAR